MMQTSFNTLKSLIMVGIVTTSSPIAIAAVPNTFNPGDVITADGMNQNFSALDNQNSLQDSAINALENSMDTMPILKITNENIDGLELPKNALIVIDEELMISSSNAFYLPSSSDNGFIVSGMGITGVTEDAGIHFGLNTILKGLTLKDIKINGSRLVLDNCNFKGTVTIPKGTIIRSSKFYLATIKGSSFKIISSDISSSIIEPEVDILNSEIDDSALNSVNILTSNKIDQTLITSHGNFITNNIFEDSTIKLKNTENTDISTNHFHRRFRGLSNIGADNVSFPESLHIIESRVSGSYAANISFRNNIFFNNKSDTSIYLTGVSEQSSGLINVGISGNTFIKGTALEVTTNAVPIFAYNNMIIKGQLGAIPHNGINISTPNFIRD